MGRRSDHSREELAGLVIAAARAIIAKDGVRGLTMRRIAARIGYAPGSIYNAVGPIEEVVLRVNAATLDRLAEALDAAIRRDGGASDPIAAAVAIGDAYMDYLAGEPRLWSALLEWQPVAPVPDWYEAPRTRLIDMVASVLAPLFSDIAERRHAVVALWAALQGVAALAAGGNLEFAETSLDPKAIARSIVLRYLTGRDDRATAALAVPPPPARRRRRSLR